MIESRRDESELKTSDRSKEKEKVREEKEEIDPMKIWEGGDKEIDGEMKMGKERERKKRPKLEIENDSDADDHDRKRQKREREVVFFGQRDNERNRDDNDQGTRNKSVEEDLDKRRRRVQECLKLKELANSYEPNSGNNWVLQEDSDDEAALIVKTDDADELPKKVIAQDQDPTEDDQEFMKVKKTEVALVNHSKIQYPSFRKNFYIEVMEISKMTNEEVATYRRQLGVMLYVKDVPKPIKTWTQTGLSSNILDVIKKLGYERPRSIQAQALPIIMSGQDCIGVASTGSGKTLAFVLPMLRHIKDQPPVLMGDGPVGLILAPTREVAQQIHSVITQFAKVVGITCMCIYGGAELSQQISDLKWGCEIVVSTPGRMIDILGTSSGISNLRRVTYLVMDDVDQMICLGIEPQIAQLVQNTRPDRQTVLFSTTFPRQVQILAHKVSTQPMGVQVG